MIDIHDLCIGNWVYDGDGTRFPMYVQTIGEDYVYLNFEGNEGDLWESTPEELQGIPLTKELLENIGFKESSAEGVKFHSLFIKINDNRHLHLLIHLERGSVNIVDITQKKFPEASSRTVSCCGLKFLHDLQNFVSITTKQQLKVNL